MRLKDAEEGERKAAYEGAARRREPPQYREEQDGQALEHLEVEGTGRPLKTAVQGARETRHRRGQHEDDELRPGQAHPECCARTLAVAHRRQATAERAPS